VPDGGADVGRAEAAPLEAGIAACGICILSTCAPAITSCLEAASCRAVFECVTTTCLGIGGSPDAEAGSGPDLDPVCLLGCAARDPAGALQVLGVLGCLTGDCGPACGPLL